MSPFKSAKQEVTALLVGLFIAVGVLVWIRAMTVKSTYHFVVQEKEYRQLEQETQNLRVQWLKLTSPKKLELMAGKIGLEPPKIGQTMKVNPENLKGKF